MWRAYGLTGKDLFGALEETEREEADALVDSLASATSPEVVL